MLASSGGDPMQGTSREIVWRNMEDEIMSICQKGGGIPGERPSGVIGYSLLDLSTGWSAGFQSDILFPAASTIKIAILLGLATRVRRGEEKWERRVPVPVEGRVDGSGILSLLRHQVEVSLWDLASMMIALSDNSATNMCIDMAGMDSVNGILEGLGLNRTRLRRKMMDLEAARRGDENVSTPGEVCLLMARLYRAEGIPKDVADDVLTMLALPKGGPFSRVLPASVKYANKPGGLDHASIDAGIIYLPGHDFCLAVMGSFLPADETRAEDMVAPVVASAYRYMKLMAECTELGRK